MSPAPVEIYILCETKTVKLFLLRTQVKLQKQSANIRLQARLPLLALRRGARVPVEIQVIRPTLAVPFGSTS
jgi:hypothetical protein